MNMTSTSTQADTLITRGQGRGLTVAVPPSINQTIMAFGRSRHNYTLCGWDS